MRAFKLEEHTLALSIIYQKNIQWKGSHGKTSNQMDFIKDIQKHKIMEDHQIRFLEPKEIEEMEINLRFWESTPGNKHK